MRNAFAEEITDLARLDHRIVLLSGDIGNRLFNRFKEDCPERFYNCGVAEANMTGVAAGMALNGLRPITYTITSFNTARCLEQIKLDICYHNLPVIVVGVGSGLSYANLGVTHHAVDDIAMLRVLPNITIICPGDSVEVKLAVRAALKHEGPVYLRLGKKNEPVVHREAPDFKIGKGIIVKKGEDVCIFSTGNMLPIALCAADYLKKKGISAQVTSMHTVKPLDTDLLEDSFSRFPVVATVEEHSIIGGFGSSVAEWLEGRPSGRSRLCRIGLEDKYIHGAGNQENARALFGLTPEVIGDRLLHLLQE